MSARSRRRFLLPGLVIGAVAGFAGLRVAAGGLPRPVMAGFAVVLLVVVGWTAARRRRLGLTTDGLVGEVGLAVVATAAITAAVLGLAYLYWGVDAVRHLWHEIVHQSAGARLDALAMGVAAAVGEELVFRGYLQPIAIDRLGRVAGLLAIAVVFACSHPRVYEWPPFRLITLTVIALIYGLLRGRDRPLTAAMTAHALTWVVWGNT